MPLDIALIRSCNVYFQRLIASDVGRPALEEALELFEIEDGRILVNELAPRPHNTGHYSIEASYTSQFENHVRAGELRHDGCALTAVHLENVETQATRYGKTIHKPESDDAAKIDSAVASVLSLEAWAQAPAPVEVEAWYA